MKQYATVDNIVCLTRSHLPVGAVDDSVADILIELTDKAKRGELLGLAVAYVSGNNDVYLPIAMGSAPVSSMVGAVGALNYEINRRWAGK